ncbi:B-cell receptor CD22 [Athene noctua]|uniref:B-cell receptor CD22 n=1 Tax=Athene noctua TaxID=126797 RepID=UPI003EC05458
MHHVNVTVTDTPPAPHLWPDPAPLTQGLRTTLGCWVPPTCPDDTPTLTWEGPVTKTLGVHLHKWTPPDTVTPFPGLGTALEFEPLWYHDGTPLNCTLRASDGTTIARATRLLQVNYAPRNVLVELKPSSPIQEGGEVTLSCLDSANPPSYAYVWRLGGRVLSHRTAQVVLRPTQATDGGAYTCEATNVVGTTASDPATLEVYYAPRDVRVEATPSSPVHEGWEVTLSCRESSNPRPFAYAWSLGGRGLPHHTAQVRLWPVNATDGGPYACRATNSLGTATSPPTTLEVYYPPRAAILEPLTPLPALAASRVTLRCRLGPAHPPAAIQWQRDERWEAPPFGHTLSFDADPSRAGRYRCIGRNPAGSAFSPPLSVVVWYPPKVVQVLQIPGGPVVAGGGPIRLQCRVGASEPPKFKVTWFKNGRELPDSAPTLVLPGPEPADGAAYVCQARNEAGGTRSPPLNLDVRFAPQGVELVPSPSARVTEGTNVTLRCRVTSRPPPKTFEWLRGGGRQLLGFSPEGLWVMTLVTPKESGRYRCRVTNDVGTVDSVDVDVVVYHSPAAILRKTFLGLGVALTIVLTLGVFGRFLSRRWKRQVAADEEPVVEPSRSFFLCNKKPQISGSPQPRRGPGESDAVGDASLLSPRGSRSVPRLQGDAVVYTVLRRNEGAAKATEGPDYENIPPGPSARDRGGDREGTLVYAALALPSSGPPRGHVGDVGDTVEYAALRR